MFVDRRTYTDFNGVERTEDFYFNLTQAEIMEMELGTSGGLAEMIQQVVDAQDAPSIIKIFKDLVLKAYGEKSADGKRIIKDEAISKAYSQTTAYSDLFVELATDAEKAAAFVNGIVPQSSKVAAINAQGKLTVADTINNNVIDINK
jgi:hypothetical protein